MDSRFSVYRHSANGGNKIFVGAFWEFDEADGTAASLARRVAADMASSSGGTPVVHGAPGAYRIDMGGRAMETINVEEEFAG